MTSVRYANGVLYFHGNLFDEAVDEVLPEDAHLGMADGVQGGANVSQITEE